MFNNNSAKRVLLLATAAITLSLTISIAMGEVLFRLDKGGEWFYFKGTAEPASGWNNTSFDNKGWLKGASPFGYGTGHNNTLLNDMKGKYKSIYVRAEFHARRVHKVKEITLSVICDGPFIAYINGVETIRTNQGLSVADPLNLRGFAHELFPGKNVIAVKCENDDIESSNFSLSPELIYKEK